MKKFCSMILLFALLAALWGCSSPIVYEEEDSVNAWLKDRTEGYGQVAPSSRMVLYKDEERFAVKIDTGTDQIPRITVKDYRTNTAAVDCPLLTVTFEDSVFAQSTMESSVFDPYRNTYSPAMQVYQKDETAFRIFFWLYGTPTDFYPIPQLLTQQQYSRMLEILEEYTAEQAAESEREGEYPIDYLGDFTAIYESAYFSDKAKNPDGTVFYQHNGAPSEYVSIYRTLFSRLGMTEQDWRSSYEKLGYTGQNLNLQIVYFDLFVGKDTVDMTLMTSDTYTSRLLASYDLDFTYSFCTNLTEQKFIRIEQK